MTNLKIMERTGEIVKNHPGTVVVIILLITVLNIFPMMNMEEESDMSVFAPDDPVIEAEDTIDADFPDPVQRVYTIVVAKDGNILTKECLLELLEIENSIRTDRDAKTYLIDDPNNVTSIADAINQTLFYGSGTTLEGASAVQLDDAIAQALQIPELAAMVSKDLKTGEDGHSAKAAIIVTQIVYDPLDPDNEDGQLAVKDAVMDTDRRETKVGVLAGFETEMEESMTEGVTLLPISLVLIIVILYLSLRRVSDVILSVVGIPIVFIWMFGISAALGMKMTMLSFFTPILILALGIDYAIHTLHRYQEERRKDAAPGEATGLAITHVGAAIFLATVTTAAAFFSNLLSSIQAVREFGMLVGIGVISAFVVMGIFLPALRVIVDGRTYRISVKKGVKEVKESRTESKGVENKVESTGKVEKAESKGLESKVASKVVESKVVNTGKVETVENRGLESKMESTGKETKAETKETASEKVSKNQEPKHPLSQTVMKINKNPIPLMVIILILTIASLYGAFRLETEFTPEDFLPEDSEVMEAMDLMVEYFPMSGTESAEILVEGDVSDPAVLTALDETVENMKDDRHISIIGGEPQVVYICPYVKEVMWNSTLTGELGIDAEDDNNDSIPDSKEEVIKIYDFLYENGIANATAADIRHVLHRDPEGNYDKTVMWIDVVDSEGMESMKEIKDELEEDTFPLELLEKRGTIKFVATGEPIVIYTVITAIMDSMLSSIAITLMVCFMVLLLVFRSVKFGVVTMIPICLIAIWILGTMFALGYNFNVISIMIVAITIGVGVDYSIHITQRYREERANGRKPEEAIENTLQATGMALLGAAATTALGFSVLAFASMKMFAAFGILTAIMVVYSFVASVIVLPVLLMLVDRKG